jgi:hypothetical protein
MHLWCIYNPKLFTWPTNGSYVKVLFDEKRKLFRFFCNNYKNEIQTFSIQNVFKNLINPITTCNTMELDKFSIPCDYRKSSVRFFKNIF